MDTQNELVSIITPNYNGAKYIADTIKSVINQTYSNWEMLIIDDCSTDNSISIINEFKSDPRIKLIRLAVNNGTVGARNKGIENANGRYISFLDSDDKWRPEKLNIQLKHMTKMKAGFSFTSYTIIDSNDKIISMLNAPEKVNYKNLLSRCDVGCSTVVYDTYAIGKQFFDIESPRAREDYVLWLKIARDFPQVKMAGVQESMMLYRKHNQGISANKSKAGMNVWRVYRDIEKLAYIKAIYYIVQYTFYGFKKHYLKR